MNACVLIGSCWGYEGNGFNQHARETWLTMCRLPHYFVLGAAQANSSMAPGADCIVFDVDDGYSGLAQKLLAARRHVTRLGHDWVFQAFTDTYVHVDRLLTCGFEQFDYYGHFPKEHLHRHELAALGCYASGGPGYWLSPRASALVNESTPDHWAEDLWVGRVMRDHGLRGAHDDRFLFKGGWYPDAITSHLSRGTHQYDPQWMRATHAARLKEKV